MWFGRKPTSTEAGLKTFTTPKIRVTRKGIYTNCHVLKNSKNALELYREGVLPPHPQPIVRP